MGVSPEEINECLIPYEPKSSLRSSDGSPKMEIENQGRMGLFLKCAF